MIESILGEIVSICGTMVFVTFSICMIVYLPKYMNEWYLEMVNRHNHNRRRRDICYELEKRKLND